MGKAVEAKATLVQRCAKFLMRRMHNAAPEVREKAAPVVAGAYFEGGSDALTTVVEKIHDARARNPDCASCPALREVEDEATDLLAQCHGAAAEQLKS